MTENLPTENNVSGAEEAASPSTENTALAAVVSIEGQEIPLDVAIATDDNLLKAALSPHYPSIQNANITRETVSGKMTVSIIKKAQHKGQQQ